MKKHEDIRRFYFFDYLYWVGEMLKQRYGRKIRRIDGNFVLGFYLTALILLPLILGFVYLFPDNTVAVIIVSCVIILAATTAIEILYSKRKKAVMKHYSRHSFNPLIGWIIALLPLAIVCAILFNMPVIGK